MSNRIFISISNQRFPVIKALILGSVSLKKTNNLVGRRVINDFIDVYDRSVVASFRSRGRSKIYTIMINMRARM